MNKLQCANLSREGACSMKRSDSIVLPVAYRRHSYEEEGKRSPARIVGVGIRERRELQRTASLRTLERDLTTEIHRRSTSSLGKDVDNVYPNCKGYGGRDLGKEQLKNLFGKEERAAQSSGSKVSGVGDSRRKSSDRTQNLPDRYRCSEDEKPPLGRRKFSGVGLHGFSLNERTCAKPFRRPADRLYKLPSVAKPAQKLRVTNASEPEPSFSNQSSPESSGSLFDAGEKSLPSCGAGWILDPETNKDGSSCSSSGSVSPLSLNSKLTELKLRSERAQKAQVSGEKAIVTSEKVPSRTENLSGPSLLGSTSSDDRLQRDQAPIRIRNSKDVTGLVGLVNEGNTCYLNSTLQCLAHSLPLASAVQDPQFNTMRRQGIGIGIGTPQKDSSSMAKLLCYSFRQVLRDLWQEAPYTAVSAKVFLQCVQSWAPQFSGHEQHDAQEVLRAILDGLHEALNRVTAAPPYRDLYIKPNPEEELAELTWKYYKLCHDSVIQDIFGGQLQSTIECCTCHWKSHCFDPFLDLSLPIPKPGGELKDQMRGNSRQRVTLQDCLRAFVAPEQLEGSNKYYCPSCKAPQTSMKKLTLYRLPPVLVLHIKVPSMASSSMR